MTTEKKNKIKAVVFDIGGVLSDGNSWLSLTDGLGCSVEQHLDLYKQGMSGDPNWRRKLVAMYQTSGNHTRNFIADLCAAFQLRPETKSIIEYLKSSAYTICLISSSFDIYVKAVAKILDIKHWYAHATLVFDQTDNLEKIIYRGDQNQVKVRQLTEFCQKVGISPTECAFVGDSDNDIGVFQATGHGIAVHCDDEYLRGIAWKDCQTLNEIKNIL